MVVVGWRDPDGRGADPAALAAAAGQGPLIAASGLLGGPFAVCGRNTDREAFGPGAAPTPPPSADAAPEWWAAPWAPTKPRPADADEAAILLLQYSALQPAWYDRNAVEWKGMWGELKRGWIGEEAGETFGAAWAANPFVQTAFIGLRRGTLGEAPPLPHLLAKPEEEFLSARARRLFDYGPPAPLYLGLHAARAALAVKPDAEAYQVLGEIYYRLVRETREGSFAGMVAYPRVIGVSLRPGVPYPLLLRHVQTVTALRRALELDPSNVAAERLSTVLYQDAGFLDLAVKHGKECVRILRENGSPDAELARQVDQADREYKRRQDAYLLKTANRSITEKVDTALEMGLVQTALDLLLTTDWDKFVGKEPDRLRLQQRELSLMMQTGQAEEVGKELIEDQDKLGSGAGLGIDPDTLLPAYEWLRVQAAAARGDYADADHWLDEIQKKMRQSNPLLAELPALGVCAGGARPARTGHAGAGRTAGRPPGVAAGAGRERAVAAAAAERCGQCVAGGPGGDRATAEPGGRPGGHSRLDGAGGGRRAGGSKASRRGAGSGAGRRNTLPGRAAGPAVPGAAERGEMTANRERQRPEARCSRCAAPPVADAPGSPVTPARTPASRAAETRRRRAAPPGSAAPPRPGPAPAAISTRPPAAARKSARPA